MRSRPLLFGLIYLAALLTRCAPDAARIQARLANEMAIAANHALPVLVQTYRAQGMTIIARARTREEATERLAFLRARWERIWGRCDGEPVQCRDGLWPALRASHEEWVAMLEAHFAGRKIDAPAAFQLALGMRRAYCEIRGAVPEADLPDVPGFSCMEGAP